jgi:putative hemolysin
MNNYLGELIGILALILLNGCFAAAEIALISVRRSALAGDAEKGSAGAKAALKLLDDPTRMLSATQVGITLIGFSASAAAAVTLAAPVAEWLRSSGVSWVGRSAAGLSVALVTLAITYVTLVIGELAPKRLGLQRAAAVAKVAAIPITWLAIAVTPVIWVLGKSTDAVATLLGARRGQVGPGVTEEEIKLLVTEQGSLHDEEKRMIHEIFELGDTVAREVMVPRVDLVLLEDTETVASAYSVFRRTGFSRIPVYHDDPDTIVGVALMKDVVEPVAEGHGEAPVTDHMRAPAFVPETKPIIDLLGDMRRTKNHMVVVVDEYGGTAGVVTIEDIVEEVIGEVTDEFDSEQHAFVTAVGERSWVVDGRLAVDDAREMLGLPLQDSEEYDTLAGWVLSELGHIPVAGESVRAADFEVRVATVRRRRIARLRVTGATPPDADEEE